MRPRRPLFFLGLLATAHVTLAGWLSLQRGMEVGAAMYGFCLGECALLAAWLALGSAGLIVRFVVVALGILTLGLSFGTPPPSVSGTDTDRFYFYLAILVVGVLAVLPGIGVMRVWRGWRIVLPGGERALRRQFSLQQLLLLTTAVCIIAGVLHARGRFSYHEFEYLVSLHWRDWRHFALAAAFLVFLVQVNLLLVLPWMGCSFGKRAHEADVLQLLVGIPVYALLVSFVETLAFVLLRGYALYIDLFVFNATQLATITATLAALRWIGFELAKREPPLDESQMDLMRQELAP
jgi:hypothetical protein